MTGNPTGGGKWVLDADPPLRMGGGLLGSAPGARREVLGADPPPAHQRVASEARRWWGWGPNPALPDGEGVCFADPLEKSAVGSRRVRSVREGRREGENGPDEGGREDGGPPRQAGVVTRAH